MTYKERLEQLLANSIQKLDIYIVAEGAADKGSAMNIALLKQESDFAEDAYDSFLELVKANMSCLNTDVSAFR